MDIVFLDIQIPEINGIELAEQLLEMKPKLSIVFVTAYDNFAIKAFELNALDYILKMPVRKERLLNTVERIKQNFLNKFWVNQSFCTYVCSSKESLQIRVIMYYSFNGEQ